MPTEIIDDNYENSQLRAEAAKVTAEELEPAILVFKAAKARYDWWYASQTDPTLAMMVERDSFMKQCDRSIELLQRAQEVRNRRGPVFGLGDDNSSHAFGDRHQ